MPEWVSRSVQERRLPEALQPVLKCKMCFTDHGALLLALRLPRVYLTNFIVLGKP